MNLIYKLIVILYLTNIECEGADILELNWADPLLSTRFKDPTDPIPDGSAVWDKSELPDIPRVLIPRPVVETDEELRNIQVNTKFNFTDDEGRIGGAPVSSVWTEIALVVHNNVAVGPAAIITSKWLLCSTRILPDDVAANSILIYTSVMNSDAGTLTAAKRYRGKEIKVHTLKSGWYSTMMLLRVCPQDLPKNVILPAADKTYLNGYMADFFNFVPTMNYHRKGFGPICECDGQLGWDPVRTLCLSESGAVYSGPNEKGSLLFVDGVFAGINLFNTDSGGETYTDISKYRDWITTTAV